MSIKINNDDLMSFIGKYAKTDDVLKKQTMLKDLRNIIKKNVYDNIEDKFINNETDDNLFIYE